MLMAPESDISSVVRACASSSSGGRLLERSTCVGDSPLVEATLHSADEDPKVAIKDLFRLPAWSSMRLNAMASCSRVRRSSDSNNKIFFCLCRKSRLGRRRPFVGIPLMSEVGGGIPQNL